MSAQDVIIVKIELARTFLEISTRLEKGWFLADGNVLVGKCIFRVFFPFVGEDGDLVSPRGQKMSAFKNNAFNPCFPMAARKCQGYPSWLRRRGKGVV